MCLLASGSREIPETTNTRFSFHYWWILGPDHYALASLRLLGHLLLLFFLRFRTTGHFPLQHIGPSETYALQTSLHEAVNLWARGMSLARVVLKLRCHGNRSANKLARFDMLIYFCVTL